MSTKAYEAMVQRVIKALETQVLFMDDKHARLAAEAAIAAVRRPYSATNGDRG